MLRMGTTSSMWLMESTRPPCRHIRSRGDINTSWPSATALSSASLASTSQHFPRSRTLATIVTIFWKKDAIYWACSSNRLQSAPTSWSQKNSMSSSSRNRISTSSWTGSIPRTLIRPLPLSASRSTSRSTGRSQRLRSIDPWTRLWSLLRQQSVCNLSWPSSSSTSI